MQNFDFIQGALFVFLFLEKEARRMIFQEICEATSMQEEREKRRKMMQKDCFCRTTTLLFDSKSDAFSQQKHCFFCLKISHQKPLFIKNHAESTLISHNNNSF